MGIALLWGTGRTASRRGQRRRPADERVGGDGGPDGAASLPAPLAATLANDPVNARWQEYMRDMIEHDTDPETGFLRLLPDAVGPDVPVALDFRHDSWDDPEVTAGLDERGVARVDALDTAAGFRYLRLREPPYDEAALVNWAARLLPLLEQGISGGPLFALWSDHLLRSPVGKTDEATKAEAAALRQEAAQLLKLAKDARSKLRSLGLD